MKTYNLASIIILSSVFVLSGCVVRTYKVSRDRLDQDLVSGNRGYLAGKMPAQLETGERDLTRTTHTVEIELRSPVKFGKKPKAQPTPSGQPQETVEGGRGYVSESIPAAAEIAPVEQALEKYTVQKDDTLQKISLKLYGTTKKWVKIYDLNKDSLKAPDKIYVGQVLNVPARELKETKENLK